MTAMLSRTTPEGVVDMVAVARWVKGDDVELVGMESDVAIHAARDAGRSIAWIAKRLHTAEKNVKAVLAAPRPVDRRKQPLTLTFTL